MYFIEGPCTQTGSPKTSVNMPVLLSSTGYFEDQNAKVIAIQGLTEGCEQV